MSTPNASRYYRCFKGSPGDPNACPGVGVSARKVETALLSRIRQLAESDRLRNETEEQIAAIVTTKRRELEKELKGLQRKLAEIPNGRRTLVDDFLSKGIDVATIAVYEKTFSEKEDELGDRIAGLTSEMENFTSEESRIRSAQEALRNFSVVWEKLDIDEQRCLLSNLVEDLRFTRHERNVIMHLKLMFSDKMDVVIPPDKRPPKVKTGVQSLTQRQLAVLDMLDRKLSRKEIAAKMGIQDTAVNSHLYSVRKRLGVTDNREALKLAMPRIVAEREFLPRDGRSRPPVVRGKELSPYQIDALKRLASGETLTSIARSEGKAVGTISVRLSAAKKKLGVETRAEAIEKATQQGVI